MSTGSAVHYYDKANGTEHLWGFGHWTALALTAVYRPRLFHAWWPLDFFLAALVVAWLSAFQRILLCY